ncbi:fibrillin-1-like [Sycon ciliatum]|uniref:fibrillin-1-like n=1 Tax=Sycon ciliatum TaxID=27933 RepID=UPI0031F5FFAE
MDIDECNLKTHNCSSQSATCANNYGSYVCECRPGFKTWNGTDCQDVDECSLRTDGCTGLATCVNTLGYFRCECPPGLKSNGTGCRELDECELNATCSIDAYCTIENGTFSCVCKPGFTGDGFFCTAQLCPPSRTFLGNVTDITNVQKSLSCSPGLTFPPDIPSTYYCDGTTSWPKCLDVDECDLRVDGCTGVASCVNTLGSFRCACPPGYKANGTGCEDINECLGRYPLCKYTRCFNEIGGFKCCSPGYIANRTMLNSTGIKECTAQACPKSSSFLGTVTDITNVLKKLTCHPGLALEPGVPATQYCDGQDLWPVCIDADECSLNIHKCTGMATCVNTHRSYQCTCSPAFRSNGTDCEDINECLLPSPPCEYERCINEIGNYTCCQRGITDEWNNLPPTVLQSPQRLTSLQSFKGKVH